ncbi:hypothetical protein ACH33_12615 [Aneurinibacillus sp. XH2]|nr:hypothetical protein ACH33_12615 [Aneurinibacillus sp. XH2]
MFCAEAQPGEYWKHTKLFRMHLFVVGTKASPGVILRGRGFFCSFNDINILKGKGGDFLD